MWADRDHFQAVQPTINTTWAHAVREARLARCGFGPGICSIESIMAFKMQRSKPPAASPRSTVPEGDGNVVLERLTQKVEPPRMYQVVMLNDDYTPMEFVVQVIQEFFNKDREAATQIMLKIHLDGKGICGVYSKDVAATKVDQVMEAANKAGHPLQCVSEPSGS